MAWAPPKGIVPLQCFGLTEKDLPAISEANPDKFGSYAPGTWIPVQYEKSLLAKNPVQPS